MTAKKKAGWKPVSVAQQKLNVQKQIRHLRKKKPVSVAQQQKTHHHQLVLAHKAKVAKAHHHAKAKTHGAPLDPDGVPCCVAQAVAESLYLATGVRVSDEDILALHWAAGGSEDTGTTVPDVLEAAQARALSGYRPHLAPGAAVPVIVAMDLPGGQSHTVVADGDGWWSWGERYQPRTDVVITGTWAVRWLS